MRDFPVFSTEHGVSGLVLREVPYRGNAYILVGSVEDGFLREHLRACASFCNAVGAKRVYAANHPDLESYPMDAAIIQMRGKARTDERQLAQLFPVTDATVRRWREVYNQRMANVDHARTIELLEEKTLVKEGGAYFIHREGTLLGIGLLEGERLQAMASTVPGAGRTVMHTLMSMLPGEDLVLEVASTNTRAITLYENLGFCKTKILRQWYRVAE